MSACTWHIWAQIPRRCRFILQLSAGLKMGAVCTSETMVPIYCPPQIPYALDRESTRSSAVTGFKNYSGDDYYGDDDDDDEVSTRQKVGFVRSARNFKHNDSGANVSKISRTLTLEERNRFLRNCSLFILPILRIRIRSSATKAVQSRYWQNRSTPKNINVLLLHIV